MCICCAISQNYFKMLQKCCKSLTKCIILKMAQIYRYTCNEQELNERKDVKL